MGKPIELGTKVEATCLAVADDFEMLPDTGHHTVIQIKTLIECAKTVGL